MRILLALVAGLFSVSAQALESFMFVPNIEGDSTRIRYEKWIDLDSFGLNFTSRVCRGLTVTKRLDVASPLLGVSVVNGDLFGTVVLAVLKDSDRPLEILRLTLTNVSITSISQSVSDAGDLTEQLRLQPSVIEMSIARQTATGALGIPITSTFDCRGRQGN